MRKAQRKEILDIINSLQKAHEEIKNALAQNNAAYAQDMIAECQTMAVSIGEAIEKSEGEGHISVSCLEEYCELLFQAYEDINGGNANVNKTYKILRKQLIKIENSIKNDIVVRKEMVFFPYKASMWDSLESIYLAAKADPECDAYCVPIPYYDLNSDRSLGKMHYEGNDYPKDIEITDWQEYDFEHIMPDVIYTHNPYDDWNTVTSIHPRFYSANLKKYTNCLVYVPYYATTGGMSEGQKTLPVYFNADYIVIQSEKYRKFFDTRIPNEKFLPFGSPKFDSVIKKCQNPPQAPAEWKEKMYAKDGSRKKVYFYNTSIGGMLDNTENFLKKMIYVFDNFKGRDDVCLLWRPHPLMDSTFDRMRPQYKQRYEAIKKGYVESGIGIYDTTPSIEDTIALSDVYIGDSATSVTSLFGVVGKPMFMLNNSINTLPTDEDRRAVMFQTPFQTMDGLYHNKYYVSYNNQLYYSPDNDMNYKYFCSLSEYSGGGYYSRAFDYKDKIYVFPSNAQYILVVSQDKIIRKIELKNEIEYSGAFAGFWIYGDYAFLLPNRYPALVRFDMRTEKITYVEGVSEFNINRINDERIPALRFIWRENMYFMNPEGTRLLCIDMDTLKTSVRSVNINKFIIGAGLKEIDSEDFWLIPYEGTLITRWNADTGDIKEYNLAVDGIEAINRRYKTKDNKYIFGSMAFMDDEIIFSPNWGNKFVKLNPDTGTVQEWISPFDTSAKDISQYRGNWGIGYFVRDIADLSRYGFVYAPQRKIYDIDLRTKEIKEVYQSFDEKDIYDYADGYGKSSQWTQYCCWESCFNSLKDELDGNIHGDAFDRGLQMNEYARINASPNGDSGEKIYRYVTEKFK